MEEHQRLKTEAAAAAPGGASDGKKNNEGKPIRRPFDRETVSLVIKCTLISSTISLTSSSTPLSLTFYVSLGYLVPEQDE